MYPVHRQWHPEADQGRGTVAVTSFKYLGAVVSHHGLKPEVVSRIEQATAAPTKWKPIWIHSCYISYILYVCESGIFIAELEVREFEMLPKANEHVIQGA